MKLPSFSRIFKQDFDPQFQPLVEKLATLLNNAIDILYQALNKNVSITDNILCTVADVDVIVDTDGVPTTTTTFLMDINSRVQGLCVINAAFQPASASDGTLYPTSGIFLTWNQNKKNVQLTRVTGLPSGKRFKLRVIAYG